MIARRLAEAGLQSPTTAGGPGLSGSVRGGRGRRGSISSRRGKGRGAAAASESEAQHEVRRVMICESNPITARILETILRKYA